MNNQILMGVAGNAPVQAPFQDRKALIARKGRERRLSIEVEKNLRPNPAAQVRRARNIDMKVGEVMIRRNGMSGVHDFDTFRNLGQARADGGQERSGSQSQTSTTKAPPYLPRPEVRDDQSTICFTNPMASNSSSAARIARSSSDEECCSGTPSTRAISSGTQVCPTSMRAPRTTLAACESRCVPPVASTHTTDSSSQVHSIRSALRGHCQTPAVADPDSLNFKPRKVRSPSPAGLSTPSRLQITDDAATAVDHQRRSRGIDAPYD